MDSDFKAVIFDLGNVVVDFDHWRAVERISKFTNKPLSEMFQLFFDSDLTAAFEEGRVSAQDFYLKLKDLLGFSISYEDFLPIWNEIFFMTPKNTEVHGIIQGLKNNNYPLILLSNINILHYQYLRDNFQIFEKFDNVILSCDVGKRKPDPVIYRKAIDSVGALPEQVVYTDDRLDLVEAALGLGIKSFQMQDPGAFKQKLIELGIKLEAKP